jgi:hypothetical protein
MPRTGAHRAHIGLSPEEQKDLGRLIIVAFTGILNTQVIHPRPSPATVAIFSVPFLLQEAAEDQQSAGKIKVLPEEAFDGNAVQWMLKKVDHTLDQIEEDPPPYAKAIYGITTGPIGGWNVLPFSYVFFHCCTRRRLKLDF